MNFMEGMGSMLVGLFLLGVLVGGAVITLIGWWFA